MAPSRRIILVALRECGVALGRRDDWMTLRSNLATYRYETVGARHGCWRGGGTPGALSGPSCPAGWMGEPGNAALGLDTCQWGVYNGVGTSVTTSSRT
jgi:hypothetical protein